MSSRDGKLAAAFSDAAKKLSSFDGDNRVPWPESFCNRKTRIRHQCRNTVLSYHRYLI